MLEELQKELDRIVNKTNNKGLDEFEGYSPNEMNKILYNPFGEQCPVQFNNFGSEECHEVPIFNLVAFTLKKLKENGAIKLTKKGFLPVKLVAELYAQKFYKEKYIESGLVKLYKESDCYSITLTRILMEVARLTKKRKGKLSLTKKGDQLLQNKPELLKELFITFCTRVNWGYFDGYENGRIGQLGFGYSIILVSKYGDIKRSSAIYSSKYFKAFPMLIDHSRTPYYGTPEEYASNCYVLRTYNYFLNIFGLIDFEEKRANLNRNQMVTKKEILDKLIRCVPPQQFKVA